MLGIRWVLGDKGLSANVSGFPFATIIIAVTSGVAARFLLLLLHLQINPHTICFLVVSLVRRRPSDFCLFCFK